MVVENDDLFRDVGELEELVVVGRDVDEHDLCAFDEAWVEPVIVAASHELAPISPASPGSPGRTEAIGTTRVVITDAFHRRDRSSIG